MNTTGLKRDIIDKYYTKGNIVDLCLQIVKENIDIDPKNDLVIEPSAGNGSFIMGLKNLCKNCKFYDIQPEHKEIEEKDYLNLDENFNPSGQIKKIHVIGNPPFGRQSSTAIKFIKKSCQIADTISFILPKSFKKESLKDKIPQNFHLVAEHDLPNDSFLVNNINHNVPCIFHVWEKREYERGKLEKLQPMGYSFVKKDEQPHISFRRVGVNAGIIDIEISSKSLQSHYFIKFDKQPNTSLLDKLKNVKFEFNNTVGPRSISKQELIKNYNNLLE